ncbi:efflux RND transporter periplasmic adaptor subunit [Luteibacter anthropi]|uniref:Efflux RND transporter periplasmic adaptor subunit n=1 Tax=Luteibacter anthropi TaxID=564369 RepID=A0A7X5UBV5_9GAMM|nr:efflux RND transporter periplasmic adaptor subunit [Luteibacter anthropi]NII07497.1 efflux RND transporter periplasmic adaptor subunit [Luteibacter anthropi]URX61235.1 efflux RND transporter periplasmic adaptor subunit [Luteibacter anthropi]
MSHETPAAIPGRPPRLRLPIAIGLGLAVVAVVAGLSLRSVESHELTQWTNAQLIPTVEVITASNAEKGQGLTLPGHLDAWISTPIHARVAGYLKQWNVDIGDKVKAGQVLATIDTPELDQQFEQAKAGLVRAQADVRLAETTATRWQNLLASRSVSKQEADEKSSEAETARANVLAAKADVDRLAALEGFKRIVAPFDGTVTARNTDIGDLITANTDSDKPLFAVADTNKMRLYTEVPQGYASAVRPGMKVKLLVLGHGGEMVDGTLIGSSSAINTASGTLRAQFQVENPRNDLLPGDFAEVQLSLTPDPNTVLVPATTLLFRAAGPQIAVVGADNKVVLRDVHIAIDLGDRLEIDHGLKPGDRIVDHPSDSLSQGDLVQIATPAGKEAPRGKQA